MNTFYKIYSGMQILEKYKPLESDILAINKTGRMNSNYESATRAYLYVEMDFRNPVVSNEDVKDLKALGWHSEQEGDVWVFPNY